MKTKTTLLTALVAFAGGASLMAQVYSVNMVGYINLTTPPGFSLVANQLTTGGNTLNQVLPLPADMVEAQVFTFSNNNSNVDIYDGSAWLDNNSGNPSTTTIAPGKGFFFYNPKTTNVTVTLVGEVMTGTNSVTLPPGYKLVSTIVPQQLSLSAANGFPQVLETLYLTFANNNYTTLINDGSQWLDNSTGNPVDAQPAVGQGFFIYNPGSTDMTWTRSFSVN